MKWPPLFKLKSGKIRQWQVSVDDAGDFPVICVEHGFKIGRKQIKETVIDEGKNLGKANETTAYQQACLEADSKFKKQLDKGYTEDVSGQSNVFRPMLAHRFDQHGHKIKYPAYLQVKLDGVRANLSWDGTVKSHSRLGKPFKVIDHIERDIYDFLSANPTFVLDGELFTGKLEFQRIISAIKRDKKNELTKKVEYWIYDVYDTSRPNLPFKDRLKLIENIDSKYCKFVHTYLIDSQEKVIHWHGKNVAAGFEGSIVRNADGLYKIDKRSYDLQKVKDFQDEEFEITGILEDKNGEAVFVCKTKDSVEFNCKPEGNHELRKSYLDNSNIGKMLTVRFFEWTDTNPPVPRFPVGTALRDYE